MGKNLIYMHAYRTLHIIYIYILYCIITAFIPSSRNWWMINHTSLTSLFVDVSGCFAVDFRKNFMVQFLFIWQDIRKVCSTRNQQIRSSWHEVTPFPSHQGNWVPRFWKWIDGLDWHGIHGIHPIFSLHFEVHLPLSWTSIPELEPEEAKRRRFGGEIIWAKYWCDFIIWLYPLVQEETKRQIVRLLLCGTRFDNVWHVLIDWHDSVPWFPSFRFGTVHKGHSGE